MTTYKQDIQERNLQKKRITVINLTPELKPNDSKEIKRKIKKQLYDVFCKYM